MTTDTTGDRRLIDSLRATYDGAAIGDRLHARLVGDDGEEYHADGSSSECTEDRPPVALPAS